MPTGISIRLPAILLTAICLTACTQKTTSEEDIGSITTKGALLSASCSGCHSGADSAIVDISGLSEKALNDRLIAYKTDQNGLTVMHRLMAGYSESDIQEISQFLGRSNE